VPNQCLLSFEKLKKQKKSCHKIPSRTKINKQDFDRSSKKTNSIHKWAASFYLRIYQCLTMTVQAVLFCWIPHRRDASTDITCSQKPKKHNSFLFLKKTTYLFYNSTTMNQIYFQNCMWLCMTLYLLTYLKVLTYFLVSFLFFCVFSLFVFFFFVKNQIQTTFFCKKILRTFLPPPNNVMLCFFLFLKTSESRKKGQQVKKRQTSNQQPNQ